jgi:uncharacterized protein
MTMHLRVQAGSFAICRLAPGARVPAWATLGNFSSVTRTPEELSIVCETRTVPLEVRGERGWRGLMVEGPLEFGLTGILAGLAGTLAASAVSIFSVSTYDTDYLFVREADLARAIVALRAADHRVSEG